MSDQEEKKEELMHVDFGYAFATPHRLTVAMPDSGDKTLLDAYPGYLRMAWTYDSLREKPVAADLKLQTDWEVHLKPELDGQPFPKSRWTRAEGWMPVLENIYEGEAATMRLEVVGGVSAAIVRVEVENLDQKPHHMELRCHRPGFQAYNPGWIQPDWDRDALMAGWLDRADRLVIFEVGGDEQPALSATTLCMAWDLEPGDKRVEWLVRPYRAYHSLLPILRSKDWTEEFDASKAAWRSLIGKAARIQVPDPVVQNAFYAGVADCFVMREPVADGYYVAACAGTEQYRFANAGEPAIAAVLLDQVGLHDESGMGYQMSLDQQGSDGNWADPQGQAHHMWGTSGLKSWAIMEHYRLTGNKAYLAAAYTHMFASTLWQERQRVKTRVLVNGERPLTYGLMPGGMGDCGLWDDDNHYGIFFPHNISGLFNC